MISRHQPKIDLYSVLFSTSIRASNILRASLSRFPLCDTLMKNPVFETGPGNICDSRRAMKMCYISKCNQEMESFDMPLGKH